MRRRVDALGEHRGALEHSVPNTRDVKKPRLSLTTIGVFLICRTTSYALASAASDVCWPTMISTSGILSTGEKKCSPMKSSGG